MQTDSCTLTDKKRKDGFRCRSKSCKKCKDARKLSFETDYKRRYNEIGKDFCPCCGRPMFLLTDGTWTHLLGKAVRDAWKREQLKIKLE